MPAEAVERLTRAVSDEIQRRLYLRVPCEAVPPGALPRFELKARRFVRRSGPVPAG